MNTNFLDFNIKIKEKKKIFFLFFKDFFIYLTNNIIFFK